MHLRSRSAFAVRSVPHKSPQQRGPRIPSGGRAEVLWRGAFGMDAKRGVPGHGWPVTPTLGTAPERSETRMPGALSLWLLSARVKRYGAKRSNSRRLARRVSAANQVTRRKAETSSSSQKKVRRALEA